MNGLAKLAWTPWQTNNLHKKVLQQFEENRLQNLMSSEEIQQALDYVKNKYNIKGLKLKLVEKPSESNYSKTKVDSFDPNKDNNIQRNNEKTITHPNDRYIFLHELGHAVDDQKNPKIMDRTSILQRIQGYAPFGSLVVGGLAGTAGAGDEDEHPTKTGLIAGSIGTLAGAGMGFGSGLALNRREDAANRFVKEYLGHQYQNPQTAERLFEQSHLPIARKTYTRGNQLVLSASLLGGALGTGIGTGIGTGLSNLQNKLKKED